MEERAFIFKKPETSRGDTKFFIDCDFVARLVLGLVCMKFSILFRKYCRTFYFLL